MLDRIVRKSLFRGYFSHLDQKKKSSKISSFITLRCNLFFKTVCSQLLMKVPLMLGGAPGNALATG